jgi:hypothetical protein
MQKYIIVPAQQDGCWENLQISNELCQGLLIFIREGGPVGFGRQQE